MLAPLFNTIGEGSGRCKTKLQNEAKEAQKGSLFAHVCNQPTNKPADQQTEQPLLLLLMLQMAKQVVGQQASQRWPNEVLRNDRLCCETINKLIG